MKRALAAAAAIIVLIWLTGTGMALDSNTLTVRARVVGTCKFEVPKTSTLNFGALNPAAGGQVSGSTTIGYWCTKGVVVNGANFDPSDGDHFTGGVRNMLESVSGDLIPYSLTLTPDANPSGGPGTPLSLTVDGIIAEADYLAKAEGIYTDTVVITLTP